MNITIVGDAMLDVQILLAEGMGARWSAEVPGQIIFAGHESIMLAGGAANAAVLVRLVAGADASVCLVCPTGTDHWFNCLRAMLKRYAVTIHSTGAIEQTTLKMRAMLERSHAIAARIDCETACQPISPHDLDESLAETHVVLASDYHKGAIDEQTACTLLQWTETRRAQALVVDTKSPYAWAQEDMGKPNKVTFTPNLEEAQRMVPHPTGNICGGGSLSDDEGLAQVISETYPGNVALTRGAKAVVLAMADGTELRTLSVVGNGKQFRHPQVVGAGDAFSAALAVNLAEHDLPTAAKRADAFAREYVSMTREAFLVSKEASLSHAETEGSD